MFDTQRFWNVRQTCEQQSNNVYLRLCTKYTRQHKTREAIVYSDIAHRHRTQRMYVCSLQDSEL